MSRPLLCFAALVFCAAPCWSDRPEASAETLIKLSVTPAPAPRPALRYRLLPELREMNPGNPIQNYMKCMMDEQSFFFDKERFDRRERQLAMPLKELPAQELFAYGQSALSRADRAARLDNPDWQILLLLRNDPIATPIPEVQQLRELARALKLRFRAEVALGRFDDAIRTAQTMFSMTRHLAEHPTLVGNLVGMAIASQAIEALEEMLEQPGCPNLYWALTQLPRPLVPLDKGFEGERMMIFWVFRDLDETAPMTVDQIKRLIKPLDALIADDPPKEQTARAWLDARTKDQAKLAAVRRRLVESGIPEERLLRFPADQVILMDEKRELNARFDELLKTMSFPTWQTEALAPRIPSNREPALYADALVPITYGAQRAQGRLDQRVALLRNVEALRLHAAEHNGAFPAKPSEIAVPLPDDPFTGRPFRYEFTGTTAHLRGTPPPGEEKNAAFNIHYQVILQKDNK
jgi:hypothetical protein